MSTQYDAVLENLGPFYNRARLAADVLYFPSTTEVLEEGGVSFEIRHCPALLQKPMPPDAVVLKEILEEVVVEKPRRSENPFLPPFIPTMHLGSIDEQDGHYEVLLNKFSVVAQHFMLLTREYKPQNSPLEPSDLTAAYKLLLGGRSRNRHFFAFYNCGPLSGSSQPHKHLQFLPLDDPEGPPVEKLAKRQSLESDSIKAFSVSALPYAHFIVRLPEQMDASDLPDILGQAFINLLDLSIQALRRQINPPIGPPAYNVILTLRHMYIIPRSHAAYAADNRNTLDGELGEIPVNSLGFAGMLLVKSPAEVEALRKVGILNLLKRVGLEDAHGESCSAVERGLPD